MYKSIGTLSALVVFAFGVSNLTAATFDTLTLTPGALGTNFLITGTFGPDAPSTPSSGPNLPYQLSFSLPTNPSTFSVLDADNELFILDTVATLNGVDYFGSSAAFFISDLGGGVQVCLGIVCNPEGAVGFATFDLFGQQLYTGNYANPTFISGVAVVDSSQGEIVFATPEPAAIALGGLGIGVFLVWARSRRRFKRLTMPLSSSHVKIA